MKSANVAVTALLLLFTAESTNAQLAGKYTIGGDSPDFASFQAAADSMMAVGISGPVDFLARPGIYTSTDSLQRVLYLPGQVTGASSVQRIRFMPDTDADADQSNVILRRFGGTYEDGFVIGVKASYTTIESITAEVSDTSATRTAIPSVVSMQGTSDSGYRNLMVDGLGNRAHSGIHYTECGDDMFMIGNHVHGADWGIELWCPNPNRLIVKDNYVSGIASHHDAQAGRPDFGIVVQVSTAASVRVEQNVIDFTGSGSSVGFHLTVFGGAGFQGATIARNRIINWTGGGSPFGGAVAGYYLTGLHGTSLVVNNTVSVTAGHGGSGLTPQGFFFRGCDGDLLIAHNSAYTSGSARNGFRIENPSPDISHFRFLNNLAVTDNGAALVFVNDTTNVEMDYNAYYSTGGFVESSFGTFSSFTDWQEASGRDEHSVVVQPDFVDKLLDLHLNVASLPNLDLLGTPLDEVFRDIDGDDRDILLPYKGADESIPVGGSGGPGTPTAPVITSPTNGAPFSIEGEPANPFEVFWNASTDPNGDELTYRYQLATTPNFGTVLLEEAVGSNLNFATNQGTVGTTLTTAGFALNNTGTLYHRVIASDGVRWAASDTLAINLTRGELVAIESGESPDVTGYALLPNYPNPFNSRTTIRFRIGKTDRVVISLYDLLGREVQRVVDADLAAGTFDAVVESRGLADGLYFYRMSAGPFRASRTLIVVQ